MKKIAPFILQGKYRRKALPVLAPVKGHDNSTPRKVKEALFQMVENQISSYERAIFYDLFAGSGQMGMEAISRGAFYTCFYEIDRIRFSNILQWLLQNSESAPFQLKRQDAFRQLPKILQTIPTLREGDSEKELSPLEELSGFDLVIFADPPYRSRPGEAAPPVTLLKSFFSTPEILPVRKALLFIQCPSEKSGLYRHETALEDKKELQAWLQKEEITVHDYGNHRIISAFRES